VAATAAKLSKDQEWAVASRQARFPPTGSWPAEMRADMAAAFLDFETSGELFRAIVRGEAPRPTASRSRKGRREPLWSIDVLRAHVARRHDLTDDASPRNETIAGLI